MMARLLLTASLVGMGLAATALGQEKNVARPILRLEAGGPTSNVTALAWAADGKTLYAAGFDKVVRAWTIDPATGTFALNDTAAFRVPIGPGLDGALNALAVSEDGQWLAAGGFGVLSEGMKFTEAGRLVPVKGGLTSAMRQERGLIHVFNTRDRSVKVLRGHSGPILSLAFGKGTQLISAAEGWDSATTKNNGEVKVWDVATGVASAGRPMPLLSFARRPGLGLSGTRGLLAWEDGNLIDWDLNADTLRNHPDAKYNTALALAADGRHALTTGMKDPVGQVQLWNLGADGPSAAAKLDLPRPQPKQNRLPLAVTWISAEEAAAVVRLWDDGTPSSDALYVFDARPATFGRIKAQVKLAGANAILPALAASPDGKHIAVAGFPDHGVRLFPVAGLGQGEPRLQLLHSAGTTMHFVRFVRHGLDSGLALSDQPNARAGNRVFDFGQRKLLSDLADWTDDPTPRGKYSASYTGRTAELRGPGQQLVRKVEIKEGTITAIEVLGDGPMPLLAIASYVPTRGATLLELYHGETGETIRRFAGHLAPIRHLSFRSDGKLLASAAEDQTVAVWSLVDLKEILGRHAGLGELALETRDQDLVVADGAAADLALGDVVRGLVDDAGKVKTFRSPGAFYEAIWLRKPGQVAKLRIARDGQERDVNVNLRQGVDVRKPLFSLFFPRDEEGKLGDWLGWNAIGPYDSSRRDVEKYLGWHFNTGKADAPTAFAFIDQYRKEYYRQGLLKDMVALGDIPPPPKPPAPKQVLLAPGVVQDGNLLSRFGAEYVLRKPVFDLHVTVPGYQPLPRDELTWRLDDDAARIFEHADGNLWSVPVNLPAGSARHKIRVTLKRFPEGWPVQEFRADLTVRYQTPAPRVELPQTAGAFVKVDDPNFALKLRVVPGGEGQETRVELTQQVVGKEDAIKKDLGQHGKTLDQVIPVTLQPGFNTLTVWATNAKALTDAIENEVAVASLQVLYEKRKDPAPEIVLEKATLPEGDQPVRRGTRLDVDAPRATLHGQIVSSAPLTVTEWDLGPGSPRKRLLTEAAKGGAIAFRFDADLKPGPQEVRVIVRTGQSEEVVLKQAILYRPPLPLVVVAQPEDGFVVLGDVEQGEVALEATLQAPARPSPVPYEIKVEAVVLSQGGRRAEQKTTVMSDAGRVAFEKLPLTAGDNEVQLTLRHAWGGEPQVHQVRGRYVRPPRIVSFESGPMGKKPFVDLSAEVASPVPPLAPLVRVQVNGRSQIVADLAIEPAKDPGRWLVRVKQVPLPAKRGQATKSQVTLTVATEEGETEATLPKAIVFELPPPPLPSVILLEPSSRETPVASSKMRLRFKATSESNLTRVEVMQGQRSLKRWDAPVRATDGDYDFDLAEVTLDPGLNHLRLLAVNDGGVETVSLHVTVPPQPVQVGIEYVQVASGGPRIVPEADGHLPPIPVGRATLFGSVTWSDADDAVLKAVKNVRVFVNNFQHLPVALKPAAANSRSRRFEVPVVLNSEENLVEIDVPQLKQDASSRRRISLPCRQPVRGQHLHVLVIAPQDKEETKLVDSLARGLNAQKIVTNLYKTATYEVVRFYVLARHVQLLEISSRLDRIAEGLKERARAGSPNDVVLIYYQGKETAGPQGPILWTSETAPWLQLSVDDLDKNYLSRFPGGQVFIGDTISTSQEIRPGDYRFAFLRRPDPRGIQAGRVRLLSQIEVEMQKAATVDQLASSLMTINPTFQYVVPEPLRNKIRLNPN